MLYSKLNKLNEVNSNYRKLQKFTQGLIAYEALNERLKNQFELIQDNLEQNKLFLERITKELYEKEITTDVLECNLEFRGLYSIIGFEIRILNNLRF